MIKDIFAKDDIVVVKLEHKFPVNNYVSEFEFKCDSEFYAKLMADNLLSNFYETIEKIRKLEYESGWSDAKKKKKKRDYFYSIMTTNNY